MFGNQPNWKDEKTWNYEIGAKTQWLDRRVTFNVSAFYSDIKDLQATTTAGTCSSRVVFNVPTARSVGVEAELFARPNANWDFGLSATYIDAKLTSSVTSALPDGTTVVVGGLADGNRLPTAPKTQAPRSVGYTLPLMGDEGLLRQPDGAVRGLVVLAVRERGARVRADRRHRGPECGAADSRSADR